MIPANDPLTLLTPTLGFGLGGPEMIWIFLLLLLLFGAKKLPQLARGIGQSLGEFKKAKEEFESEIRNAEVDLKVDDEPTPKIRQPAEKRLEVSTAPPDDEQVPDHYSHHGNDEGDSPDGGDGHDEARLESADAGKSTAEVQ